jgi:orotate phosphoribosyltransferase
MADALSLLRESGAMLEGHFLLSSGRHSDRYFQCARLFQYPDKAAAALAPLATRLAADIKNGALRVDAVVGPALGGILPAWELGRQLGLPAFFTERAGESLMTLRRGFTVEEGMSILIAEDVVTTCKSALECAHALQGAGAVVSGLACVVDRRQPGAELAGMPFYAACKVEAGNWDPADCELCAKGIPLVKPGSRKV